LRANIRLRVAIDIGGGFVDLVAVDEQTGEMSWSKTRTTPEDLSRCVAEVFRLSHVDAGGVSELLHGQTLVINAILQRKGAKVGLITSKGFRDVLALQRSNRRDIFNLRYRKPESFVPRHRRLEVDERTLADGEVLRPVDEQELLKAYHALLKEEVEGVAISFINSYANPANEVRARDLIEGFNRRVTTNRIPFLSTSSDISREWREYERTNTCVLNTYVMPLMDKYLRKLTRDFRELGMKGTLYMMLSGGGVASFEYAAKHPIETVESGPVAGIVGAIAVGERIGARSLIAMDGGSTTTKASLIPDLQMRFTSDYAVERDQYRPGYPIKVPVVDVSEIGVGGGSIGWLNQVGDLQVGPLNAGADPGPACYGLGGTQPTLTDAYLVAGFLNPAFFLGGALPIHPQLAAEAVATVADHFKISVDRAAFAIVRIANDNAAQLLRLISVQRGFDPRDFAMVAYGGSGPMVAPFIAEELEIPKIVIPSIPPGNFSAWGLLMSDLRHAVVQTMVRKLESAGSVSLLNNTYAALERNLVSLYRAEGQDGDIILERAADFRYCGQEHTITVPVVTGTLTEKDAQELSTTFSQFHEREYGFRLDSPVELVNLRLSGMVKVRKATPTYLGAATRGMAAAHTGERMVYWGKEGRVATVVFRRDQLPPQARLNGPAIIEEPTTTIVVPKSFTAAVDEIGNLILERT
jgi:N-methylhydantoinase A